MQREQLADLAALVVVAQERSFTRAAAKLGVTQSTLSHTIRRLESRLGLRLLDRTTRSVAPTEAGERLLRTLRPAFQHIDTELASLSELREKPAGTIRITTSAHAADTILMPALERLLPKYPEIQVEITVDYALTDVVTERFDAGIRSSRRRGQTQMVACTSAPAIARYQWSAPTRRRPPPAAQQRPTTWRARACLRSSDRSPRPRSPVSSR
jgi:DNA-binding transcriptional LysR family regulator